MEQGIKCGHCRVLFLPEDTRLPVNFCPLCGLDLRPQTCQMCGAQLPSGIRAITPEGESFVRVHFCFVCGAALPVYERALLEPTTSTSS